MATFEILARMFFTIIGVLVGCYLWQYFEGIFDKLHLTVVYKVDLRLKNAYETDDAFLKRAVMEGFGTYRIKGYYGR